MGEGEDRRARTTIVTPPTRAVKALLSTPLISREEEGKKKNRDLYLSSASNQHFSSALLFPPLQPDQSYLSSSASSSLLRLPLLSLHSRFGLFIQTSGSLRQPFVASHRKTEREPGRERVRETERERERKAWGEKNVKKREREKKKEKTIRCHGYAEEFQNERGGK